jgi:hypothetical protein
VSGIEERRLGGISSSKEDENKKKQERNSGGVIIHSPSHVKSKGYLNWQHTAEHEHHCNGPGSMCGS